MTQEQKFQHLMDEVAIIACEIREEYTKEKAMGVRIYLANAHQYAEAVLWALRMANRERQIEDQYQRRKEN